MPSERKKCPIPITSLSFSKCHYKYQGNLPSSGQIRTSQLLVYPYPQYLQFIRIKESGIVMILGDCESEYSHGKESISNMQKHNRRIRPEILELSSKFGIIFVTEAYNESILLQDNTEMYLFDIYGT
jgi:hypothetical protein